MGRYVDADCRRCRTLGQKLFLKAKKCYTAKCILERRNFRPGQHGKIRKKSSEYSVQLNEKQKLKTLYGMLERQFRIYFDKAAKMKGVTGNNLVELLERRLDNVVMRSGLASSRDQARQFVRHGHVRLNGKTANIPSLQIRAGDKLEIRPKEKSQNLVKSAMEFAAGRPVPSWLKVEPEKFAVNVVSLPKAEDAGHNINVQLIVELYSK